MKLGTSMQKNATLRDDAAPSEGAGASSSTQPVDARGRRQHNRYRVQLDVTVTSDHNFYAGFAENMSVGGLFIATHQLKAVGDRIDFSLQLPGSGEPIRGSGVVRWVRVYSESSDAPPGLGIRFEALERGAQRRIAEFLEQREPLFYDED
jgi:uncharacterized protein (TIGR02266 family)